MAYLALILTPNEHVSKDAVSGSGDHTEGDLRGGRFWPLTFLTGWSADPGLNAEEAEQQPVTNCSSHFRSMRFFFSFLELK